MSRKGGDYYERGPGYIEITEEIILAYFVMDIESPKVEFEKPFTLLSETNLLLLQDILPSLEAAAQARRSLVIIAEDIDCEALTARIRNRLCGQLQVAAVNAPGFGHDRKSILGKPPILMGGTVFIDELDIKLGRYAWSIKLYGVDHDYKGEYHRVERGEVQGCDPGAVRADPCYRGRNL